MHRRQLPLAYTCSRDLMQMPARAGGRERWCEGCERVVHDLSQLSEVEARLLLRRSGGPSPCVAYRVDARGEVLFRRTRLDRISVLLASTALLVSAGCMGFAGPELESEAPDGELSPWVVVPACEPEPEPVSTPVATPVATPEAHHFELPEYDPEAYVRLTADETLGRPSTIKMRGPMGRLHVDLVSRQVSPIESIVRQTKLAPK